MPCRTLLSTVLRFRLTDDGDRGIVQLVDPGG
jgi:hypothetical protein